MKTAMKPDLKSAALVAVLMIAVAVAIAVTARNAQASPGLSMSFARQQMQQFVMKNIVQRNEQHGVVVAAKIDSTWRVSSTRVNFHVTWDTHQENPATGSDIQIHCSGTWTTYLQSGWFRLKNVSGTCA